MVVRRALIMKSKFISAALIALLTAIYSDSALAQGSGSPLQVGFDFRAGSLGWQSGFADYTPFNVGDYDLRAEIRDLPPELGAGGTGFYFQGMNRSDDLFMFMKRRLTPADGIVAGQRYEVYYRLVFASNACSDCAGIGGHPGYSVYLKAGASPIEPAAFISSNGRAARMNVDIGAQSNGGIATSVTGGIANGLPYSSSRPYVSIRREHRHSTPVTASASGELWLLVGTDSGFEGFTQLYYQSIDVTLVPVGTPPASAPLPALLVEENTGRAVSLNAATLTREPFTHFTTHNLSHDQRTRALFFATNLQLAPDESASAVSAQIEDAQQRLIQAPVEFVGKVPGFEWLTQIVVRLPAHMPEGAREVRLSVSLRGAESNKAPFSLTPPGNNPL